MGCSQSTVVNNNVHAANSLLTVKNGKPRNKKTDNKIDVESVRPFNKKATYACFASSHSAKVQSESTCSLRGVTFLTNGSLVTADYKNNKLKLFSSTFEFQFALELSSAPWDVCETSDKPNDVFVTVPYKRKVYRIFVCKEMNRHTLTSIRSFRTEGFCWGISCFNGGVAVSVKLIATNDASPTIPDFQIHIYELDGTFRRAIIYDQSGAAYFSEPKFLNATHDYLFLLVSDYKQHKVLCLNNEDELIYEYAGMKHPNGIAMDEGKNVHITSFHGSQRIHKVGANGKYKDGLSFDESRPLFPYSICYRCKDRIIVLTTDQSLEAYRLM